MVAVGWWRLAARAVLPLVFTGSLCLLIASLLSNVELVYRVTPLAATPTSLPSANDRSQLRLHSRYGVADKPGLVPAPPPAPKMSRGEAAHKCEMAEWMPPAHCRKHLPCDLRAFDPGRAFNHDIVAGKYGRERLWAKNNVDPASRHFQNGVEWWVQHALPPASSNVSALRGARRVFVAAYFSYLFIFAPHVAERALRQASAALGADWRQSPEHFVVAHGHPGACLPGTSKAVRLLVDADLSCSGSARHVPVPYVVSHPAWLALLSFHPQDARHSSSSAVICRAAP